MKYSEHGGHVGHRVGDKADKRFDRKPKENKICERCREQRPIHEFIDTNRNEKSICHFCHEEKVCKGCKTSKSRGNFVINEIEFKYCKSCIQKNKCPICGKNKAIHYFLNEKGDRNPFCNSCMKITKRCKRCHIDKFYMSFI